MKAVFETIEPKKQQQSFMAYHLKLKQFHFWWHYHSEYELTLILKGKGKRLVGDCYQSFSAGDLVLLGSNLPHTWASDHTLKSSCEAIVIQFSADFIQSFTQHQECRYIEELLAKSTAGLSFNKSGIEMLHHKIQQLPERKDADRIIGLLSILNELSHQKSKPLSSTYFQPLLGTQYEKRINKVCQFIQKKC